MDPLIRLRLWLRQRSRLSKVLLVGAVVVIVGGVVGVIAATSGGGADANAGSSHPAAGSACSTPSGSVRVGIVLAAVGNGGSLNQAIGIPAVSEQRADFQAVIDDVNSTRGQCYSIDPVFETFNYVDPASAQSACLKLVQSNVIAMLGGYSATSTNSCPLQHKLAVFDNGQAILPTELQQFYPYYFAPNVGVLYKDFVYAAAQAGYFSSVHGNGKIGLVYRDCIPGRVNLLLSDLKAAGVQESRLSKFSLGCPAVYASPASLQQAALQFKQDRVKIAVSIADSDMPAMTKTAEQQGFKPQWLMPDGSIIATTLSKTASKPDPQNFNGAFVVAVSRYGEDPSAAHDSETMKCNAIMAKAGLKSIAESPALFAGAACDYTWTLNEALQHAKAPVAADLAAGLQQAGALSLAFPAGPARFEKGSTSSSGPWRVVRYNGSCSCWNVPDTIFHPAP